MNTKHFTKIQPNITEKTVRLADKLNIYTFNVSSNLNKLEVADFVEKKYKVKVVGAKVTNLRAKRKISMLTKKVSFKSGGKKVLVKLKKGDKIDVFDINTNKAGK